ncbi:MAG: GFA family protein [Alphaproteobacteria bacterium]|nr:GFA family protein [Alphaproteobacteria bacterium]
MIEASCHCGALRLQVPKPPEDVEIKECNCSICRRTGAILAYYSPDHVRVSGPTDVYMWGDRSIEFHRCKVCGNFSHWIAVDKSYDRMGVNVRLMPAELLTNLRIPKFDGANTWTIIGERRGL